MGRHTPAFVTPHSNQHVQQLGHVKPRQALPKEIVPKAILQFARVRWEHSVLAHGALAIPELAVGHRHVAVAPR